MLIQGSCHCGNLSFRLAWDPDPAQIHARACGCSFCVKHGGVWTGGPACELLIRVRDPARLEKYLFGTRTAEFHICTGCGIVPVVTSRIEDHLYALVNVNTFDGVETALLNRSSSNFDGEGSEARLARRQRNWIGNVGYENS